MIILIKNILLSIKKENVKNNEQYNIFFLNKNL